MTDLTDLVLPDAAGAPTPLAGHLLCLVEHAFTPDAERVARLAARAHRQGTPCRLVSADSAEALSAFIVSLGVDLPVAADPDGTLARRLGRWNEATFAPRPGWAQVGRDGRVITAGDGDLPRALLVFLGTAQGHADPGTPPAERAEPPARMPPSGWLYLGLSAALVVLAVLVYVASGGRSGHTADVDAAPPPAPTAAQASAEGAAPAAKPGRAAASGEVKGRIGGGWYAVPPALGGKQVRFVDGVVEVEGADTPKPPMACQEATVPLTAPVHVRGTWQLDHVGGPATKGARVAVRLLDERGTILPPGSVPGGAQIFVANGRMVQDWAPFEQVIAPAAGATQVRLCVDNLGGTGVVRVKDVTLTAE